MTKQVEEIKKNMQNAQTEIIKSYKNTLLGILTLDNSIEKAEEQLSKFQI